MLLIGDFLLHILPLVYCLVESGQLGLVVLCVGPFVIIETGKELVIESDDPLVTSPVFRQIANFCAVICSGIDAIHQTDEVAAVCPAEGIDTLLGITDDEILVSTAASLVDEWPEVGPLQPGGILKLIDYKVVQSHTHSVVDKGGVVSVYDLIKELIHSGNKEQVILMLILLYGADHLSQHR